MGRRKCLKARQLQHLGHYDLGRKEKQWAGFGSHCVQEACRAKAVQSEEISMRPLRAGSVQDAKGRAEGRGPCLVYGYHL